MPQRFTTQWTHPLGSATVRDAIQSLSERLGGYLDYALGQRSYPTPGGVG